MATSSVAISSTPRGQSDYFTVHSRAAESRTPNNLGADRLTARPARDIRLAMSAVMTVEREQVETKPPKRQPAAAHQDRFALDEVSPFLLLAAAVVQHARMDQTHRCSSNCKKLDQCRRATISARLFLTALRTKDPAWGGVWLDWLEYAAARAGLTLRRREGWL
jgi:hypothetical protein